jgi:predicted phage terminase large subunit-like protein
LTGAAPSLTDIRSEKARRHLRHFVRQAWPILEPETKLTWGWHMDAVCDHLEAVANGEIRQLLINIPPGHGKSLLVSVFFPAWMWLRKPSWRAVFASYKGELANRDAAKCRDVIASNWYQESFCPAWRLKGDQNVKSMFGNTMTGMRQSIGVGGGSTGFRGDAVIVDDPLKADEFPSPESLEKVISWWTFQMSSRLNDMRKSARIVIMQRLHERDLSGYILERGGYEHLCLPSEYNPAIHCSTSIGFEDPRTEQGELLFPERFDETVIAEAKTDLGPYGYSGQHDQAPTPSGGGLIKRHQIGYWYPHDEDPPEPVRVLTSDGVVFCEQRHLPTNVGGHIQSWDLAFKGKTTSDPISGQVWASKGSNAFLLDRIGGQMDIVETIEAILELTRRWPETGAKYVEDKANGPAVMRLLRDKVTGLIPVQPNGGKEARVHAVVPYFAAGNVWLPHPSLYPWVADVVAQFTSFPTAPHDDDVDAMTQALPRLIGGADVGELDFSAGIQVSQIRI